MTRVSHQLRLLARGVDPESTRLPEGLRSRPLRLPVRDPLVRHLFHDICTYLLNHAKDPYSFSVGAISRNLKVGSDLIHLAVSSPEFVRFARRFCKENSKIPAITFELFSNVKFTCATNLRLATDEMNRRLCAPEEETTDNIVRLTRISAEILGLLRHGNAPPPTPAQTEVNINIGSTLATLSRKDQQKAAAAQGVATVSDTPALPPPPPSDASAT